MSVAAEKVTADGTGVVVYGREGAVHVTTGTVSAGSQGDVGVYAQSTTGDIVVDAGVTRTANTGLHAGFTADGVGAYSSDGGHVTVSSLDSAVVGQFASAVYGVSTGGAVEIDSGKARASSASTVAVYGRADQVTITSQDAEIVGASARAIQALADHGDVVVTSDRAVASDTNGIGIDLFASHDADLTVTGLTSGGQGGVRVSALNRASVTVGADASITSTSGVGVQFNAAIPVPEWGRGLTGRRLWREPDHGGPYRRRDRRPGGQVWRGDRRLDAAVGRQFRRRRRRRRRAWTAWCSGEPRSSGAPTRCSATFSASRPPRSRPATGP
jgi:fibronectin-binding autotransporter adhesin